MINFFGCSGVLNVNSLGIAPQHLIFSFLLIFISSLLIFILVRKIGKIFNHNRIFWMLIFSSILVGYFFAVYIISVITGDLTITDFILAFYYSPVIFIWLPLLSMVFLLLYEVKYENNKKMEEYSTAFTFIVTVIIGIAGVGSQIILNEAIELDLEKDIFYDNVKAGIFFYGNETNPYGVNISMYVLNQNPDFYYDEVIFILAFENESYNLTIRKKEGIYDLTGADDFNITRGVKRKWKFRDDKKYSNYTRIIWNDTTHHKIESESHYLQGGTKNFPKYVYANFTVNYTEKNKMIYSDEIKELQVILIKNGDLIDKILDYNPMDSQYYLKILDFGIKPDIRIVNDKINYAKVFSQIKNA